ncbi:MAG: sensor histidine kinase [Dechloromonas sp.]|nr:sensor histidine kinase [Dechloromonas sp.]
MQFRLVRHFTLTSLAFIIAAGAALGLYYREIALSRMLQQQESNNVNLSRVFANTLWQRHFSGLLKDSVLRTSPELKLLSQIPEIHREVLALMRGSTTYKIKVYDLRGRTIYSSELAQIGEDKRNNPGFLGALEGLTRTELVHKEKFSAFEQVVENRDLIQSYIPQYEDGSSKLAGVFEIYSDATPFLAEIRKTEIRLALLIAGAMAALFSALFFIVQRADRIIRQQADEKKLGQQQLAQAEKMASLGQLVAGVSHQMNTPIAFSHNNIRLAIEGLKELAQPLAFASHVAQLANDLPADRNRLELDLGAFRGSIPTMAGASEAGLKEIGQMLDDVQGGLEQMRELVENLRNFTHLDRSKVVRTDINETLKTVIYIARSSIPSGIRIVEQLGEIPAIACNPSQLNQVFLNLITNAAQAIPEQGEIRIRTALAGRQVVVEVSDDGTGIPDHVMPHIFETYFTTKPKGEGTGLGLAIAQDIVRNHGGTIAVTSQTGQGTCFTVTLPVVAPDALRER